MKVSRRRRNDDTTAIIMPATSVYKPNPSRTDLNVLELPKKVILGLHLPRHGRGERLPPGGGLAPRGPRWADILPVPPVLLISLIRLGHLDAKEGRIRSSFGHETYSSEGRPGSGISVGHVIVVWTSRVGLPPCGRRANILPIPPVLLIRLVRLGHLAGSEDAWVITNMHAPKGQHVLIETLVIEGSVDWSSLSPLSVEASSMLVC
jgi:hypothetical protein